MPFNYDTFVTELSASLLANHRLSFVDTAQLNFMWPWIRGKMVYDPGVLDPASNIIYYGDAFKLSTNEQKTEVILRCDFPNNFIESTTRSPGAKNENLIPDKFGGDMSNLSTTHFNSEGHVILINTPEYKPDETWASYFSEDGHIFKVKNSISTAGTDFVGVRLILEEEVALLDSYIKEQTSVAYIGPNFNIVDWDNLHRPFTDFLATCIRDTSQYYFYGRNVKETPNYSPIMPMLQLAQNKLDSAEDAFTGQLGTSTVSGALNIPEFEVTGQELFGNGFLNESAGKFLPSFLSPAVTGVVSENDNDSESNLNSYLHAVPFLNSNFDNGIPTNLGALNSRESGTFNSGLVPAPADWSPHPTADRIDGAYESMNLYIGQSTYPALQGDNGYDRNLTYLNGLKILEVVQSGIGHVFSDFLQSLSADVNISGGVANWSYLEFASLEEEDYAVSGLTIASRSGNTIFFQGSIPSTVDYIGKAFANFNGFEGRIASQNIESDNLVNSVTLDYLFEESNSVSDDLIIGSQAIITEARVIPLPGQWNNYTWPDLSLAAFTGVIPSKSQLTTKLDQAFREVFDVTSLPTSWWTSFSSTIAEKFIELFQSWIDASSVVHRTSSGALNNFGIAASDDATRNHTHPTTISGGVLGMIAELEIN